MNQQSDDNKRSGKRALRRHHKARMKAKARRIFPDDPEAHHLADHMAFCRGMCCRNPRTHWHELPLKEERANAAFRCALEDIPYDV